jgi:hypothetical protein
MNDAITFEDVLPIFHWPLEQAGRVALADSEELLQLASYFAGKVRKTES